MYCRHCGKEVEPGTKFCRFCGGALSGNGEPAVARNIVKTCPICGAVPPDGAKFCNKCGYPMQAAPSRTAAQPIAQVRADTSRKKQPAQKKRSSGFIRAVSLILVAAILVTGLWKPGFMLPWIGRIGIFKPADPAVAYNTDSLVVTKKEVNAIEPAIFTVGEDETVAEAGDITVDLGVLEGEHTLEIRDIGMRKDHAEDADVRVIDLRLDGGKTQPEGYVAVTMPYNPDNDDPLDTVTARHYDDKTKTWTVLPAEFDTDAKTITFWVNHFSLDSIYDTSESRIFMKEQLDGQISDGTLSLPPVYEEYKEDGTGFDLEGAGKGAAVGAAVSPPLLGTAGATVGFYIGGKMAEWNNDEPFLYNQADIQEGKGALTRVTFNSNRLAEISKNITTQFDTLKTIAKQENNWQDDPTVAGKSAVALGFVGNGATATDNIQQILSSMGKIAAGTSEALAKKFFAVGVVLTGVKFCVTWYDKGSFTSAFKENSTDVYLLALGGISLAAPPPFNVVAGVVAGGLWAATAIGSTYENYDESHITRLRNGHYDNDIQKVYMTFTKNYVAYSETAAGSGKWPGGLICTDMPEAMEKSRDYLFNTNNNSKTKYIYKDCKTLGSCSETKSVNRWGNYLDKYAYYPSKDTAQLAKGIDTCFENAADVFWRLPRGFREEFAKDVKVSDYRDPDSSTIGTYKTQMKQVLAMMNTKNIDYYYNRYKAEALTNTEKTIQELTDAMNTVTSFSFYVTETQENGKPKKVPLGESQYKGYIAAFCTGKEATPMNAAYGTVDDWIFQIGSDKVQFQCTAYNWIKAGEKNKQSLNWIRLFKDEKALKYNESAAEASFEFANGGVEVIFGALDDIEGEYEGTITPTGVYLGDLWYKIWGEQFGLKRGDCDDAVSLNEGVYLTGVTIRKAGSLLSGGLGGLIGKGSGDGSKYTLTFHVTETEDGVTKTIDAPVDAEFTGGKLVIKNDNGTTAISVIQEQGRPTRLTGTGVIINFDKVSHAQMYLIIDISVEKKS
ncbi:MAG: zinc ribbon domain-containing protein [Clostridia bacterium]|nr:zinc ribbon domain-containing protein [Clostridia bacterium]